MNVEIQPVLKIKDGMVQPVSRFLVLLIPIIMDLNAFVLILEINANHGNTMMESNVFISQDHVHQRHPGMEHIVLLILHVLLVFMV